MAYDTRSAPRPRLGFKFKILAAASIAVIVLFAVLATSLFDSVDAGWVVIKQGSLSGNLTVISQPGPFFQGFGKLDPYKQAVTIGFGSSGEDSSADMGAIDVRFADSGKAQVYGNARFELPFLDEVKMKRIHTQYRSFDHLVGILLEKEVAQVTGLTAQMMTAEETYTGGRGRFIEMCLDQLQNGLYQTDTRDVEVVDPISGDKRRVRQVTAKKDLATGKYLRNESELSTFDIKVTQYILSKDFDYEEAIDEQIKAQRDALSKTNTARAASTLAVQKALTAKAEGDAQIATARAEQMVLKETETVKAEKEAAVAKINAEKEKSIALIEAEQAKIQATRAATVAQIEAEQRLKVAELDKKAADEAGQATILKGKADATSRELALKADGALKVKLDAWVQVNQAYALAIQQYKGNWVPSVVMGSTPGGAATSGAQDLINMLLIKTAKDLAVDASPSTIKPVETVK